MSGLLIGERNGRGPSGTGSSVMSIDPTSFPLPSPARPEPSLLMGWVSPLLAAAASFRRFRCFRSWAGIRYSPVRFRQARR
jgi:hypothetical protein